MFENIGGIFNAGWGYVSGAADKLKDGLRVFEEFNFRKDAAERAALPASNVVQQNSSKFLGVDPVWLLAAAGVILILIMKR